MDYKFFKISLLSFVVLEILSFFSHAYTATADVGFFAVVATVATLAFWRLEYGVYFLLAELFLGGKGHLLNFEGIPLRIAIFCVIMGVWAGKMIVKKKKQDFSKGEFLALESKLFKYYFALSVFVLAGILIGFLRGNGFHNVVLDANAWVYFLIVFPVFEIIKDRRQLKNILEIFLAAITVTSLKTIGLFLIFSKYGFDLAVTQAGGAGANSLIFEIYKWVRNSGAGEITPFDGFYRIFLQSQVFIMIGFFVLLWLLARNNNFVATKLLYILLALSSAALFISFSRSFWVGIALGGLVFLWFLIKQIKWRETVKFSAKTGLAIIAGIFLVFAVAPGILSVSGGRVSAGTEEAAIYSRMNLLPELLRKIKENPVFGSGFGAMIAYESKDPRLAMSPLGKYKTYAFEWGYLDIWMKIGVFGFLAYLLLILKIFAGGLKNLDANLGLLCALLALCATNVFSPYLNHPLGIGAVILIGLVGQTEK